MLSMFIVLDFSVLVVTGVLIEEQGGAFWWLILLLRSGVPSSVDIVKCSYLFIYLFLNGTFWGRSLFSLNSFLLT